MDNIIVAVMGYAVVFLGIILLMVVISIVGKVLSAPKKKAVPAPAPQVQEAPAPAAPTAPGSAGSLKLHDVEPKTAALLMAIVANKLDKPLNELRFISIKEVK